MKVCLVTSVYPPRIGGPATQTYHLVRQLSGVGVAPFVVTWGTPAGLSVQDGVRIYRIDASTPLPLRYVAARRDLKRLLLAEAPDIFHYQSGVDYFCLVASQLVSALGIPSVVKFAGDLVWERMAWQLVKRGQEPDYRTIHRVSWKARALAIAQRRALLRYDKVWSPSRYHQQVLERVIGIPAERIVQFPNYSSFRGETSGHPAADRVTIACVSRFAPWKRIDHAIEAFAKVDNPNVRLRIVGGEEPDAEASLRQLAARLGVADRVEFSGVVTPDGARQILTESDIFLTSTAHEPMAVSLLEALGAALPIVATDVGGNPEAVTEGENGFLVPSGDVDAMAARLTQLAADAALRRRMSDESRRRGGAYELESHLHVFRDLYERLIASRREGGLAARVAAMP